MCIRDRDTIRTGRRSETAVTVCYLEDVCNPEIPEKLKRQIAANEIDIVADSSYVGRFISSRPRSLFKRCGTCEKPDIFCAKLCEGRVGLISRRTFSRRKITTSPHTGPP